MWRRVSAVTLQNDAASSLFAPQLDGRPASRRGYAKLATPGQLRRIREPHRLCDLISLPPRFNNSAQLPPMKLPPLSTALALTCFLLPLGARAHAQSVPADHAERMARGLELFRSDVSNLLKEHCVKCHGDEKTKSDFDLATREGLLRGGSDGSAIKPFFPAESPMLKMMSHEEEPHMPEKKPKLTDDAISKISQWIELGAPYDAPLVAGKAPARDKSKVTDDDRKWWAFQPLVKSAGPAKSQEIDAFLLAKAADKKLGLAPEADKRTLLRRATLDLIGLPPTPEEMAAFLADNSAQAFEKVIDRLLASPHYGERWARHWLDVARFAESSGFEHDYDRPHAYHYRDFVIRAFNEDMPFDQFARWQLAGDEFAPDNSQAMMATGFLGAGVFPTQITANEVERTRYDALDDMLATTGSAFLGLTVGCARCHDHKFDPLPAKDYYEMLSAFTTTVRSNVDLELDPKKAADELAQHEAKKKELESKLADYEKSTMRPKFAQWLASADAKLPSSSWQLATVESISSKGKATFTDLMDGSWLASGANPGSDLYTLVITSKSDQLTGLKLEALTHESFPSKGPGRAGNGNFALSKITISATPLKGGPAQEVKISKAEATHEQNKGSLSVASSLDNDGKSGWAVDAGGIGKDQAAVFHFAEPLKVPGGVRLTISMDFQVNTAHCIGRPRVSLWAAGTPELKGIAMPGEVAAAAQKLQQKLPISANEKEALFNWMKPRDSQWQAQQSALTDHLAKQPQGKTPVMVCAEGFKPIVMHSQGAPFLNETHYLKRGDTNQKQGEAKLGFMQVLNRTGDVARWKWDPPAGAKYSGRRRTFANWLTDADQGAGALMARVTVNRLWQHHLGRGIVPTTNDLGKSGTLPSHPELLEWMASEFVRGGWKVKPMHRLIMLSAAYRQASTADAGKQKADPENLLFLQRMPSRLEGEIVRDSALAVAGMLDPALYGKGTLDENSVRRSIYFTIKRSQLVNSMVVFDAPEPLSSQGVRPTTTVAPQALLLMNSPQIRTWATAFAKRLEKEAPGSDADFTPAIQRAYALALGREPRATELAAAQAFIQHGLSQGRTVALTDFCQTLFSLNEFAYLN